MSDEEKKIEELEQQLKIAKMEKKLAELKNENSQEQKPVSKKKQKELDKELEREEKQDALDNVYKAFLGIENKPTRATILKKLENTEKKILVSEYFILNRTQQKTYKSRVNWFSLLLYPCAIVAYLVALFFQHPWRNSLIFVAFWFFCIRPGAFNVYRNNDTGKYCFQYAYLDGGNHSAETACYDSKEEAEAFLKCFRGKDDSNTVITDQIMLQCQGVYQPKTSEAQENQNTSDGAIGDEVDNVKTLTIYGIGIPYSANAFTEQEVKKAATKCYNDGHTSEDSLNQCVGNKLLN